MKAKPLLFLLTVLFFGNACRSSSAREEVIIRAAADPESLNPINYSTANALQIINLLYQSLLATDLEDNQFKPLLVEQLPQVVREPPLSYFTYRLREEAAWDEQHPITARDVVFTLKVIKAPLVENDKLNRSLEFVRDIKIDPADPKKFTIICAGYVPEMSLALGDFAILPAYLIDPEHLLDNFLVTELTTRQEVLSRHPQLKAFADWFNSARFTRNKDFLKGSGGYELADWRTGQYVRLRKKQFWWGARLSPSLPYVTAQPTAITFRVIPENTTALLVLKNEQLDVFHSMPAADFVQLRQDQNFRQKYQFFTPPTYDYTYIGINGRQDTFADKRTRQALAHLLDIPKMIRVTQLNFATRTVGPVNPADKQSYNARIQPYVFNLKRAVALLTQAGWQRMDNQWQKEIDGQLVPLTITLTYRSGNSEFENIALIFRQAAAKINIPVTIQPLEAVLLKKNLEAHQFEVTIRYASGNPFLLNYKSMFHSEGAVPGGENIAGFGNAESDQLIDAINQTQDAGQKARMLQRLQEILHDESNLIFLYFNTDRIAVHKRYTNLKISGLKPGYDVSAFTLRNN